MLKPVTTQMSESKDTIDDLVMIKESSGFGLFNEIEALS